MQFLLPPPLLSFLVLLASPATEKQGSSEFAPVILTYCYIASASDPCIPPLYTNYVLVCVNPHPRLRNSLDMATAVHAMELPTLYRHKASTNLPGFDLVL